MSRVGIKGIIAATATGMNDDESINIQRTKDHVERMISAGVDAVFCLGTNGEFYALEFEEKLAIIEAFVEQSAGRVPVYAGTGCATTAQTVRLSKAAVDAGADVLSIITPYFAAASQSEQLDHYSAVANAVDAPIVAYNIPARAGNKLAPETVAALARIENVVGVKDSSGNFDNILAYIEKTDGENFAVLSGNDALILPTLKAGGAGGITAIANVYPQTMVKIYRAFLDGDEEAAQEAQEAIAPLRDCFRFGNPNTVVKTAANIYGNDVGPCRAPFNKLPEEGINAIREVLAQSREKGIR